MLKGDKWADLFGQVTSWACVGWPVCRVAVRPLLCGAAGAVAPLVYACRIVPAQAQPVLRVAFF